MIIFNVVALGAKMLRIILWSVSCLVAGAVVVFASNAGYAQAGNGNRPPAQSNGAGCKGPTFCFQPYVSVLGGLEWGQTHFNVVPSFNVNSSGGFVEAGVGVRLIAPGTNMGIEFRLSEIFSQASGSTFYPPSAGTYGVKEGRTAVFETGVSIPFLSVPTGWDQSDRHSDFYLLNPYRFKPSYTLPEHPRLSLFLGVAEADRRWLHDLPTGNGSDTSRNLGFTTSVRLEVPIVQGVNGTAQFRYMNFGNHPVHIPGEVFIRTDEYQFGVGLTMPLSVPTPVPGRDVPVM